MTDHPPLITVSDADLEDLRARLRTTPMAHPVARRRLGRGRRLIRGVTAAGR